MENKFFETKVLTLDKIYDFWVKLKNPHYVDYNIKDLKMFLIYKDNLSACNILMLYSALVDDDPLNSIFSEYWAHYKLDVFENFCNMFKKHKIDIY